MTEFEDEVLKLLKEILALLKINKRPNNAVLVPCDKLAEMQAEIEALKVKAHEWYLIAMEKAQEK